VAARVAADSAQAQMAAQEGGHSVLEDKLVFRVARQAVEETGMRQVAERERARWIRLVLAATTEAPEDGGLPDTAPRPKAGRLLEGRAGGNRAGKAA
jgi:hypothetical protein